MSLTKRDIDQRYEDAVAYINYCVKEGEMDESEAEEKMEWDKVSFLEWAEKLMDEGDRYTDSIKHEN